MPVYADPAVIALSCWALATRVSTKLPSSGTFGHAGFDTVMWSQGSDDSSGALVFGAWNMSSRVGARNTFWTVPRNSRSSIGFHSRAIFQLLVLPNSLYLEKRSPRMTLNIWNPGRSLRTGMNISA